MKLAGSAALATLLTVLAPAAHAEKRPRIAVLEVTIEGDAPPELRGQIGKSLGGGIYAAGYDVVDRDEVAARLRGARALVGCMSTTCLAKIATLVNAKKFIRARALAAGAAYTIELELYAPDAPSGLVDRLERSCPVCTLREVNDLVSKAALELVNGRPPAPESSRVSILSRPPGARIEVDGVFLGDAPVEAELDSGQHLFHATLSGGYRAANVSHTLAPGERSEVILTLVAVSAPAAVEPSRYGGWKWAAAGGSVAFIATGIALLAVDGSTTDCATGTPCKSVYATKGLGVTALIAGAALGGVATYLFFHDRVETTVAASATGAQLTARLKF
jgi:PEGA domain